MQVTPDVPVEVRYAVTDLTKEELMVLAVLSYKYEGLDGSNTTFFRAMPKDVQHAVINNDYKIQNNVTRAKVRNAGLV